VQVQYICLHTFSIIITKIATSPLASTYLFDILRLQIHEAIGVKSTKPSSPKISIASQPKKATSIKPKAPLDLGIP